MNNRRKRGILDFVREISKILFGTTSEKEVRELNEPTIILEKAQTDFFHIVRNK